MLTLHSDQTIALLVSVKRQHQQGCQAVRSWRGWRSEIPFSYWNTDLNNLCVWNWPAWSIPAAKSHQTPEQFWGLSTQLGHHQSLGRWSRSGQHYQTSGWRNEEGWSGGSRRI